MAILDGSCVLRVACCVLRVRVACACCVLRVRVACAARCVLRLLRVLRVASSLAKTDRFR